MKCIKIHVIKSIVNLCSIIIFSLISQTLIIQDSKQPHMLINQLENVDVNVRGNQKGINESNAKQQR